MRVRTLFLVAVLAVAAPGLVGSAWIAGTAWSDAAGADQAIGLTQALGAVMRALVATAVERGTLVTVAAGEASPGMMARATAAGEAARAAARQALARLGTSAAALDADDAALAGLVRRLGAADGKPRPDLASSSIRLPTALIGQLTALDQSVQARLVRVAPAVAADTALAQSLTALRAVAGLRSATVEKAWVPGDVADRALIVRMYELGGRVAQAWAASQAMAGTLPPDHALSAALAATRHGFFAVADPRYRALVTRLAAHQPPVGSAAALHAYTVHWLATLQQPRDAALAAALRIAHAAGASARLRLALALLGALAGLGLAFGAGLLLWRRVIAALGRLTATLGRLAAGALDTAVPDRDRGDEIGAIAEAVETLRAGAAEAGRLAAAAAADQANKLVEAQRLAGLLAAFERGAGEATAGVAEAAGGLKQTAANLTELAQGARGEAGGIADSAAGASASVDQLAGATEELSASIREISSRMAEAATAVARARTDADGSAARVGALAETASGIGDVVRLIEDIAGQTNLLALNATIEAARAGDAGKGFAVVAGEVKGLATQTAQATGRIAAQIATIQAQTGESVAAIAKVAETIGALTAIATTVASAVEQQRAATDEIARSVQQAAQGTGTVSTGIAGLRRRTEETSAAAERIRTVATDLDTRLDVLQAGIASLLAGMRAPSPQAA
ncbi:MAG: HAMP domain-containing protein [Proteobacteria bacterium]|nr:HAMP domain-containing protein [Pseudomonadota bacterium]